MFFLGSFTRLLLANLCRNACHFGQKIKGSRAFVELFSHPDSCCPGLQDALVDSELSLRPSLQRSAEVVLSLIPIMSVVGRPLEGPGV
jgi:hypothetical protein